MNVRCSRNAHRISSWCGASSRLALTLIKACEHDSRGPPTAEVFPRLWHSPFAPLSALTASPPIRCSRQRLTRPWSPLSLPKETPLAAPLLAEIRTLAPSWHIARPQAEAPLEALLLGVSEECALGTARSTSAGLLPLRAVCDGILVRLLLLGSHVRDNISRECLFGSRGHYFALERSGEMDNVVGAASPLLSAWNPCVHASCMSCWRTLWLMVL